MAIELPAYTYALSLQSSTLAAYATWNYGLAAYEGQFVPSEITVVAIELVPDRLARERGPRGVRAVLVCESISAGGVVCDTARHAFDGRVLTPVGWSFRWETLRFKVRNHGEAAGLVQANVFAIKPSTDAAFCLRCRGELEDLFGRKDGPT